MPQTLQAFHPPQTLNPSSGRCFPWTAAELESWFTAQKQPKFRIRQLQNMDVHAEHYTFESIDESPSIPASNAGKEFRTSNDENRNGSGEESDPAEKFLLELSDGNRLKRWILHNDQGQHTLCASTPSRLRDALRLLCERFGRRRSKPHVRRNSRTIPLCGRTASQERGERPVARRHYGMGEPTANLDALLAALSIVSSEAGLGIGARKITISTVGIPQGIARFGGTRTSVPLGDFAPRAQ